MPRAGSPYGYHYRRQRHALLASRPRCVLLLACQGAPATTADHDPPLALHGHVEGSGCCRLIPACLHCQKVQGALIKQGRIVPRPSRLW